MMSEGRALTNAIGNSVATMVIARWQGERDDERFQAALRDPSMVEEVTGARCAARTWRTCTTASAPVASIVNLSLSPLADFGQAHHELAGVLLASVRSSPDLIEKREKPSGAATKTRHGAGPFGGRRRSPRRGRLPYAKGSHPGWPGRGAERVFALPSVAAAAPKFKVLVFSKTAGFRHDSIETGVARVKQLGTANNFAVDATEDAAAFTAAQPRQVRRRDLPEHDR